MPAIPQPGVTVIQEIRTTSPTVAQATLPACIIGPSFQVIETQVDGLLSADALAATYDQYPLSLGQSSFPDPRGNIAELDIQEDTVEASLFYGGQLIPLPRGDGNPYGTSFLAASNVAAQAVIVSTLGETTPWAIADGDTLVLAFDRVNALDTSQDVIVTVSAAAPVATAQEVVDAINTAVGATVAFVVSGGASEVMIRSTLWGARSSIDIRAGSTVSSEFFGDALSRRAEASGYRGQDDVDGDLTSPWIEFFRGEAYINAVPNSWGAAGLGIGQWTEAGVVANAYAAAITFTGGSPTIPLQAASSSRAGDAMTVEGSDLGWEVVEVQASRFRMAQLDSALSTFDTEGNATTRVYLDQEVNVPTHGVPFAPRFVWFEAQGLQWPLVSPPPIAAVLTGNLAANAATKAEVQTDGSLTSAALAGTLALSGLTLVTQLIEDGVTQPQVSSVLAGVATNAATLAAALDALAIPGIDAWSVYDNGTSVWCHALTTKTGADQSFTVLPTGTANSIIGFSVTTATTHSGLDQQFAGEAVVTGAGYADPVGLTMILTVNDSKGTHVLTYLIAGGGAVAATVAELEMKANQIAYDGDIRVVTFTVTGGTDVLVTSVEAGATVDIAFSGTAFPVIGLAAGPTPGTSDLQGTTLEYALDGSNEFGVTFGSDSLPDAIGTINQAHGSALVASISGNFLRLTSPLGGVASSVDVSQAGTSTATSILGFVAANDEAFGSGRPNPDAFLDLSGGLVIGAHILRNLLTGAPFLPASASLYVAYEALRLDVSSSSAAIEKLLTVEDQVTLEAVGEPIDERNPLFLGMFLALLNSPTTAVTGIGVDEVSAAQPEGTLDSYARAFDYLEAKDVYALAPLTENEQVHQSLDLHVSSMSLPEQRGERIGLIAPEAPTRAFPTAVASGVSDSTAAPNELTIDTNPTGVLVGEGLNPAALSADDGVYVEITVGGEFRRYNVQLVNSTLLQLRTTFAVGENDDGFYTTTSLSTTLVNVAYALKIRGEELLLPGSTLPDLPGRAAAVAAMATDYLNRRMFYLFPDSVTVELGSGTSIVPAYYAAAAVAGQFGHQPPAQPLTNFPITGLSAVQGSHDTYKRSLLDEIAGGGVYILYQQTPGGAVMCRHQLSTDTTSIERREASITKAIDFVAKFLRNALRNLIGRFNITPQFLNNLATVIQGQLAFLGPDGLSVVAAAQLNNVLQDETAPDTILVDVTLTPLYPANQIRVTLVV